MMESTEAKLVARNVGVHYGQNEALRDVTLDIVRERITALIGPSGCGKTTLLRCFNRMNDTIESARVTGTIELDGANVLADGYDAVGLRRRVGMVFQKPNPFPKSIYDNVAYGPRITGLTDKGKLDARVKAALEQAALWDEVSDRLDASALGLSGGQQQRLCIARALAVEPEVLLMDEPTSALDPIATKAVEDLIRELAERLTVVIVTHNMQQAQRLADYTAFFYMGDLIEAGTTKQIFSEPEQDRTKGYVSGAFG